MKNKLWEAVFAVFEAVDRDGTGQLEAERLIALRKTLRLKLDILRSELAIQLNDREIYHVLFPVVVYLDEILQSRVLPGERVEYLRLQKELFDIDTGGNTFYEVLDDLLQKPDTYPFVFEVFYFCLSSGFVGRHKGNLVELTRYKEKVAGRIVLPELETIQVDDDEARPIEFESFPWWYYVVTVVVLVGTWQVLHAVAPIPDFVDRMSELLPAGSR